MKKMKKVSLTGGLVCACVAAAVLALQAPSTTHAQQDNATAAAHNPVAWQKFAVRPVDQEGIIFSAAMHLGQNGEVDGELADVFLVNLSQSEQGVRATHPETALAPDSFLAEGIVANLSAQAIKVFLVAGDGPREFVLQPYQSFLVGEPSQLLMLSHVWGCLCTCVSDSGQVQSFTITCKDLLPQYGGSGECNFDHANNKRCTVKNENGDLVSGTSSNCLSHLVPATQF